jgi:hypothetical protein
MICPGTRAGAFFLAVQLQMADGRTRIEKLGLKPHHRYGFLGGFSDDFLADLAEVAGEPSEPPLDQSYVRLDGQEDLGKLEAAKAGIRPNGAVWAVWPKGGKALREDDIRRYATIIGLVDVKVMSFSDRLSGLKLVIPLALRPKG